jgi:hypothetical protein
MTMSIGTRWNLASYDLQGETGRQRILKNCALDK